MQVIEHKTFDEERALYGSEGLLVRGCTFAGPADGESALKESRDIAAEDCRFDLRYPFWHDQGLRIAGCELTPNCRAALWYCEDVAITDSRLHGIKALRECRGVTVRGCDIVSPEFGWSVRGLHMEDSAAVSEYFLLRGEDLHFRCVRLQGKYSFQYVEGGEFEQCEFDTKDAFWHSRGVTVKNSLVKGEYLGWYSDGLTLINCRIEGTQPLCYCKNLRLIDCEMVDTDLCFERSEVEATIRTPVVSIKNPRSGRIRVPAVGEQIWDDPLAAGKVEIAPAP